MTRPGELLVLSSEHGSNAIPHSYEPLFAAAGEILQSHRGWDIGSADLSRYLARALDAPLVSATVSRLLVDCNRSSHHRHLFSEFTRQLPGTERETILRRYYYPYRKRVSALLREKLSQHRVVVHVSVHSFVPELNGRRRNADIGLLYDPNRAPELNLCRYWQDRLKQQSAGLRVRRNYPYKGISDGLVTQMRKIFAPDRYIAVELEFSHDWSMAGRTPWRQLRKIIGETLDLTIRDRMASLVKEGAAGPRQAG